MRKKTNGNQLTLGIDLFQAPSTRMEIEVRASRKRRGPSYFNAWPRSGSVVSVLWHDGSWRDGEVFCLGWTPGRGHYADVRLKDGGELRVESLLSLRKPEGEER